MKSRRSLGTTPDDIIIISDLHLPRANMADVWTAEQGVRDMNRRLAVLRQRLAAVQARGDTDLEPALLRQISETNQLLSEYQLRLNQN